MIENLNRRPIWEHARAFLHQTGGRFPGSPGRSDGIRNERISGPAELWNVRGGMIVLVTETTFPPTGRGNLRLVKLARELANNGKDVIIFTPSYLPWQRQEHGGEGPGYIQFSGFGKLLYGRLRLFIRTFHILSGLIAVSLVARKYRIQAFHGWNTLSGFSTMLFAKYLDVPFSVDFTDLYSTIAEGDSPLVAGIFRSFELSVSKRADHVFAVSGEMKKILEKDFCNASKIMVVPDGTDFVQLESSMKTEVDKLRKDLQLEGSKVCIFHGDAKPNDGLEVLIDAFALLAEKGYPAKLLILGESRWPSRYVASHPYRHLLEKDVILVDWVPLDMVPHYLALADVGVLPFKDHPNNHMCYSFKLLEYLALGKPVVVTNVRTISKLVRESEVGLIVDFDNPTEIARALTTLFDNGELASRVGERGKRLVESRFRWDKVLKEEVEAYA